MNSISYRIFYRSYRIRVRSFIARLFGLCLLFFGSAASVSAQSPDYTQQLRDIDNSLTLLNGTLGNIWNPNGPYLSEVDFDYQQDTLLDYLVGPQDTTTGQRINPSSTRNILALLQQLNANVKRSGDLAGNAWWATNSAFALTFNQYSRAYPSEYPNTGTTYSFPQFASRWSAMLTLPTSGQGQIGFSTLRRDWWRYFGSYSRTADASDSYPYTWFDWMSDAMRSNLVLSGNLVSLTNVESIVDSITTEGTASQLIQEVNQQTSDSDPEYTTNSLPDWIDLTQYADMSDAESSISDGLQTFFTTVQPLSQSVEGSYSSEMVVIPAFTVGGIHVSQKTFDFARNNPVVQFARGFMSFLWGVMLFASLFALASSEWAYYANLGRTWTKSEMLEAVWSDRG